MIILYVLNNNFSDTQLAFAYVPQKDSYYLHDNTDAFFLFLLQKIFDVFWVLLFEAFFCIFNNIYLSFSYIDKKNL